jgi:site-specific DNA-methyltransferase (adenine-specific)
MTARRSPGVVRDAIIRYLGEVADDASVDEICASVRNALGGEIARSSVRSYLNLNTPNVFLRTARGRYRLVRK